LGGEKKQSISIRSCKRKKSLGLKRVETRGFFLRRKNPKQDGVTLVEHFIAARKEGPDEWSLAIPRVEGGRRLGIEHPPGGIASGGLCERQGNYSILQGRKKALGET